MKNKIKIYLIIIFIIACTISIIKSWQDDKKATLMFLEYSFNGKVSKVDYDIKKQATVIINDVHTI